MLQEFSLEPLLCSDMVLWWYILMFERVQRKQLTLLNIIRILLRKTITTTSFPDSYHDPKGAHQRHTGFLDDLSYDQTSFCRSRLS